MWTKGNLYLDLPRDCGDATAIAHRGREIPYGEFFESIDRFAAHIRARGVPIAGRVGIVGLEGPDLLAAIYGCAKVGAVSVPLPRGDPARNEAALEAARARLVLSECPDSLPEASDVAAHPEAMVIFTSGTTSEGRKGVILGHEGISSTAAFMNKAMGVDASIRECVFAPLDHAFGFGRCHAVLMTRGTLLLQEERLGFEPLFESLAAPGTNALSTVPSVLATLLRLSRKRFETAGAGLRWVQTGAMRFDRSFRDTLCEAFPNARIYLHYGLSEAMRVTFMELHGEAGKRHTEGRPSAGVEIAILGESGERLGPGREGTIAIRGRNLALGYLNEDAWRASCRDGWFVTADRGSLDEDGYLVFAGRSDDVINANGNMVHPDEIEARLHRLLAKRAFSVLGMPDPRGVKDKIVVLAIEGRAECTAEDIAREMEGAADFMIPRIVISLERLPRTASGKVSRAQLAKELAGRLT